MTTTSFKSKLKKALKNNYIKNAVLIMIIIGGMLSFWFGLRTVLRTEYPFFSVVSGSMLPTIKVGDLIVVQGYADPSTVYAAPPKWDDPVKKTRVLEGGDIVVFWHMSPGQGLEHWVHRAVGNVTDAHGKRYLITLGDANYGNTDTHYNATTGAVLPGLPEEYIVGKVVVDVPYIGQAALFFQTPSGRVIIIVLIVAMIVVEFIPFSRKKDKEQVPKQEEVNA
jgi:signal peptidase I